MEKDSVNLRKNEQQARLNLRLQQGDRAGAQAIRNILVAEDTKEMWRQLLSLNPPPLTVASRQSKSHQMETCLPQIARTVPRGPS